MLRYTKPVPESKYIKWSEDLFSACKSHVEDIGPKGLYGTESSIGMTLYDRIPGPDTPGMLQECISYSA